MEITLRWNDRQEELSLRVKFSKGKQRVWLSVKLACEYMVDV